MSAPECWGPARGTNVFFSSTRLLYRTMPRGLCDCCVRVSRGGLPGSLSDGCHMMGLDPGPPVPGPAALFMRCAARKRGACEAARDAACSCVPSFPKVYIAPLLLASSQDFPQASAVVLTRLPAFGPAIHVQDKTTSVPRPSLCYAGFVLPQTSNELVTSRAGRS